MSFDDKLDELFIDLPEPPPDLGTTIGALLVGKTLSVCGALPFSEGRIQHAGRAGVEVKADTAKLAARIATVMALAMAKRALGGTLDKIRRVVRLDGFVACGADFRDHARVIDGASELLVQIFGPSGKHVRNAVGVTSLPQNACAMLSIVFEVK
jgi:enamine deaminase RidA (YjgF/YER057c/UK114 family)